MTAPMRAPGWLRVQLSFDVKINFLLGLGLAILVAVWTLAHRSIDTLVETGRNEAGIYAALEQLEALLGNARDTAAVQRSYLLTDSRSDRLAYAAARERIGKEIDGLRERTRDEEQSQRLRDLQSALAARLPRPDALSMAPLRQAALAQASKPSAAAALDQQIENIAEAFRRRQLQALRSQHFETGFSADTSSFLITWGTAFACALLAWAMINIHRHQVARRAAENAVRASEAQLRLITDSVPALIGYVDRDGRLLFHNHAFERWFGRPPGEVFEGTLRGLFGEDSYRAMAPHVAAVLEGKAADFNFSFRTPENEVKDLSAQLVPRREDSGAVPGYYALVTDITALTEVERIKSEFVTTVSHELRTPLTSIRGSLGLLAGGVTGALPEKARELVTIAIQNCERLVRLVNDILDSERMMSGKMQFNFEPLDPSGIIERCLRETEAFAAANGVRLHYQPPGAVTLVRADRDRLAQVVTNLLSNACKFSPAGGMVELSAQSHGGNVRIEVCDRGLGVPAAQAPRLFARFMQVDASNLRRQSGTGLGLSICKGLIERMDGRIGYAPRAGGGSVFFFELPVWRETPVQHG
jgi:PAS domain S-box-containing protein